MPPTFQYQRRVRFYETDAMGVVHHSNHWRILEEARVEFIRKALGSLESFSRTNYPLISASIEYKKPLYFDEEVRVQLKARVWGARLQFDYSMEVQGPKPKEVALAKTVHVAYDTKKKRVEALPRLVHQFLEASLKPLKSQKEEDKE